MAILTNKPTPGADDNTWGVELNTALDELDVAIEADRARLTALEARPKFHVGPTAPADTSFTWIDTSV